MTLKIKKDGITEHLRSRTRRRREGLSETKAAEATRPPRNDLLPDLQAELRPLDQLKLPARNVRSYAAAQIERLKRSIGEFGVVRPILIRRDGEIVDGGGVFMADQALNLAALPCFVIDHLTDTELRKLRLSLNRLQELGDWDFPELTLELADLMEIGEDLAVTGFEGVEIDTLLLDDDPNGRDDVLPEDVGAPIVSKLGDAWRLGPHRLICGDARDPLVYQELLGDTPARLVLTDPPYNVKIKGNVTRGDHQEFAMASGELTNSEFGTLLNDVFALCDAHLVKGGLIMPFIDWRGLQILTRVVEKVGCELLNLIVWNKTNAGMGAMWRSQHELLPVFKKPGGKHVNNIKLGKQGRYRSNVWTYPGASSLGSDAREGLEGHPTPKPVALLEDGVLDVTHAGDLVIDPFSGSGSTIIACENTGRRCRAIELEPRFVDLTVRRWQDQTGKIAMHEETGESFEERQAAAMTAATDSGQAQDHG